MQHLLVIYIYIYIYIYSVKICHKTIITFSNCEGHKNNINIKYQYFDSVCILEKFKASIKKIKNT